MAIFLSIKEFSLEKRATQKKKTKNVFHYKIFFPHKMTKKNDVNFLSFLKTLNNFKGNP